MRNLIILTTTSGGFFMIAAVVMGYRKSQGHAASKIERLQLIALGLIFAVSMGLLIAEMAG